MQGKPRLDEVLMNKRIMRYFNERISQEKSSRGRRELSVVVIRRNNENTHNTHNDANHCTGEKHDENPTYPGSGTTRIFHLLDVSTATKVKSVVGQSFPVADGYRFSPRGYAAQNYGY